MTAASSPLQAERHALPRHKRHSDALAGVWPAELRAKDKEGLQALESRFVPFVEKAVREAKLRTNWAAPDETYEAAVIGYARRLLLPGNNAFLEDFVDTLQPFI